MNNNIDTIMQETRRYWYEDGFAEIAIGLLFSTVGGGLYLQYRAEDNPLWLMVVIIGLMLFILFSVVIVRWVVTQLKERVTYPRTGYVEYNEKPDPVAQRFALIFPIIAAAMILFLPEAYNILGVAVGLMMGAIMAFFAYRTGVWRFLIASLVAIGAGILGGYLTLNEIVSTALVFGIMGIVLLLSGAVTLLQYIQNNPSSEGMD